VNIFILGSYILIIVSSLPCKSVSQDILIEGNQAVCTAATESCSHEAAL